MSVIPDGDQRGGSGDGRVACAGRVAGQDGVEPGQHTAPSRGTAIMPSSPSETSTRPAPAAWRARAPASGSRLAGGLGQFAAVRFEERGAGGSGAAAGRRRTRRRSTGLRRPCASATRSATRESGAPGGMLPETTRQVASARRDLTASATRSQVPAGTVRPDSLRTVVRPVTRSTMAVERRAGPGTGRRTAADAARGRVRTRRGRSRRPGRSASGVEPALGEHPGDVDPLASRRGSRPGEPGGSRRRRVRRS